MFGLNSIKRAVKRTAGWAASLETLLAGRREAGGACVFAYHRVSDVDFVDPRVDDWNVPPATFERQVAALNEFAEIVPLLELPARLRRRAAGARPLVSLTFDDGYASFYKHALPVLKRYGAPATAFVVTGTVGDGRPQPFDDWAVKNEGRTRPDDWRAMTWDELEDCAASGLVHVGAHSHRHLRGSRCTPEQLTEEAARSREVLRERFGDGHARAYAYPYGNSRLGDASAAYAAAVSAAGYEVAVTTDLGLATAASDPLLLPRVEAHALDAPAVLRAKARGALASYRLTDNLRLLDWTI
ncbi:MAG TPA: polysaccharide deacetylase family protein [Pyrinomonadaceae bacterium]|nr:polysaccharide deacetylase family protein [Pyrinomonadaceae bacterium]